MAMRVVDGQLFIGDEGRFIYYAGLFVRQPYYIPPDDIQSLDRRRFGWLVGGFATFLATLAGAGLGGWSIWWCAVGALLGVVMPPVMVERWVRERFVPVSDPSVVTDVRRTAVLRGPTVGAALMAFMAAGLQSVLGLGHRSSVEFVVLITVFAVQLVQIILIKRGRDEFGAGYIPPSSSVTR